MSTVVKGHLRPMPQAQTLPTAQRLPTQQAPPRTRNRPVSQPPPVGLTLVRERLCDWCKVSIAEDASVCPNCKRTQKGAGPLSALSKSMQSPFVVMMACLAFVAVVFLFGLTCVGLRQALQRNTIDAQIKENLKSMDEFMEETMRNPMHNNPSGNR